MNITTLARIVARKLDLQVVNNPRATTFSIGRDADGKLVMFCPGFVVTPQEGREADVETLIRGGVAHEALGHGHHTDFDALGHLTPFAKSLVNIIEDIRIERLAPEIYPGARTSLKHMAKLLESRYGFWNFPSEVPSKENTFAMSLVRRFRTKILRQDLPEEATQAFEADARREFGASRFAAAVAAAERGCFAPTTAGAVVAAKEALAILMDENAPEAQSEPKNPAQPSEKPNKGGSESSANNEDSQPESSEQSAQEDAGENEGDDGSKDDSSNNPGSADGKDSEQPMKPSETESAGQGCQANENGTQEQASVAGASNDAADPGPAQIDMETEVDAGVGDFGQLVGGITESEPFRLAQLSDGTSMIAHAASAAMPKESYDEKAARHIVRLLQGRLGDSLTALAEDEDDSLADLGRLDTSRLAGIAAGMEREPFTQEGEPGRNIATDLFILFDKSDSMKRLNVDFLRQVLFAMGTVLARFAPDVKFDMAWFDESPTLVYHHRQRWTPRLAGGLASSYAPSSSTDWPSSAISCLSYFDDRSPRRKVLLTITDGYLGQESSRGVFLREARAAGVECAFVSVGHGLPSNLHGATCSQQAAPFAKAVYRVLLQCMTGTFR